MYKYSFLFILLFSVSMSGYGQAISDSEAIRIAVQAKKSGASDSDIASRLLKAGATPDQIQRIRSQYAKQITKTGMDSSADNIVGDAKARMRVNNEVTDNEIVTHESELAPEYTPGPL